MERLTGINATYLGSENVGEPGRLWPVVGLLLIILTALAVAEIEEGLTASAEESPSPERYLFSPEGLPRWRVTPGYENQRPWQYKDGAYEGFESWTAHPGVFDDFDLHVEVLFSGKGEGGIVIRGNKDSRQPWADGYELDIDWAADRKHGHLHFPGKPKPYAGEALFEVGQWQAVKVRASGENVTVFLNGKQVLQFKDNEFSKGNICLEGHADGVKYRNLRIIPMGSNVRREGDRVWVEGVEAWGPGERANSVMAAHAAAMKAMGRDDITYEYLMGASGTAFRMQVSKEGFCGSSPHSFCGFRTIEGAMAARPYKVRPYEAKPDDEEGVARARRAIVESIGKGWPCVYGSEEDGVIAGYQKDGAEWLCVHPWKARSGKKDLFVETKWPWGIGVYTEEKAQPPDRRAVVVDSLRLAVQMAKTKDVDKYHLGFSAWNVWMERLSGLDELDEKSIKDHMMGNSWLYTCLADARLAAATYLRSVADDFGEAAAGHLQQAADLYEQMVNGVLTKDRCALEVAPTPWFLKEGQTWDAAMRRDQVARLKAALHLEKQAIAAIEKALASVE